MPLNKVFMYVEGVVDRRKQERKETVSDLVNAIGISFSGKGYEEYIKQLSK